MSRYIDAHELTIAVRKFFVDLINTAEPLMADDEEAFDLKIVNPLLEANRAIRRLIKEQKAVDVVEVVHGEWIKQDDGWDGVYYECSVCKEAFTLIDGTPTDNLYNFCPNCGADMRGGTDE